MNAGQSADAGRLVGRASQLAVAVGSLDDLERGRGTLLLLTGEAGIGKTRLAEEVLTLARVRGWRGAWATAWQGDGAPPLWPWVQVLRQIAGSDEVLGGFVAESPAASASAMFAQSDAVAAAIRRTASQQPLVVVLDDLQWADTASIRVLAFVASIVRDVGCLLLGTYRSGELPRDQVAELARVGRTIAIPQLTDDAAAELLRAAAGVGVSSAATTAVLRRSLGNPLFVWEFGQLMAQSGRLDVAPAAVPDAVAAVIERRLARLPESTIEVLGVAAVAGTRFTVELLAQVGDIAIEAAAAELAAAAASGLVTGDVHALDDIRAARLSFSHDLVRDVVLDAVDPVRRVELHLRVAEGFAERVADDASLHAVVADHLDRAGPAHRQAAAEHWELAALQARRVLAYHEAARCFARAAHGWPDDLRRRASLLADEGDCLLLAGELDPARARFRDSAQLACGIPDPLIMSRAVLGIGTGPVAWEVPIASDEQIALVANALELLPEDATALRSMLLARLSVTAARPETMQAALHRAQESLRLAEQVGDPRLIAQALAAVNDALAGPAHTMTRRDNADTIVELALAAGDRVLELLGYRFRIVADLEVGDLAAVDRDIAAFSRLAEQLRQPLVSWYVPLFRGMRALLAGDLDTADRHQREVAAAAEATGSDNAEMLAATLRLGHRRGRGPAQPIPRCIEDLFDVDPADWASYAAGLAMARLQAGDHRPRPGAAQAARRQRLRPARRRRRAAHHAAAVRPGRRCRRRARRGRAGLRPVLAARAAVGGRRHRRLLLGTGRARAGPARPRAGPTSARPATISAGLATRPNGPAPAARCAEIDRAREQRCAARSDAGRARRDRVGLDRQRVPARGAVLDPVLSRAHRAHEGRQGLARPRAAPRASPATRSTCST